MNWQVIRVITSMHRYCRWFSGPLQRVWETLVRFANSSQNAGLESPIRSAGWMRTSWRVSPVSRHSVSASGFRCRRSESLFGIQVHAGTGGNCMCQMNEWRCSPKSSTTFPKKLALPRRIMFIRGLRISSGRTTTATTSEKLLAELLVFPRTRILSCNRYAASLQRNQIAVTSSRTSARAREMETLARQNERLFHRAGTKEVVIKKRRCGLSWHRLKCWLRVDQLTFVTFVFPRSVRSSILIFISSEFAFSSGAYMAEALVGNALNWPGISARRR